MMNRLQWSRRIFLGLAFAGMTGAGIGCGGGVSNEESARRAYLGLDRAVDRAISLGFDGLNAASSANIPPQMGSGDVMGAMLVEGQVSQGSSSNREMRLTVGLTNYQDRVNSGADGGGSALRLVYDRAMDGSALALTLSIRPNDTPGMRGTLTGTTRMSGELEGAVTLNLAVEANVRSMSGMGSRVERVAGTTRITGTVTSAYGTYTVDVTR